MAEHPIMRGESIEAYTRRINRIVAEKTTNAIREVGGLNASRPAGDAFSDMLNAYANGSTDGVTTPGSSSGSNSTPSIAPSLISGAAQVLGVAAQTITAIITSNNQTEIARVRAQAEERLIALQQQTNASRDSANQQQQEVLQQFIAAMNQRQSMSVGMMIAIGLGIAVVVGGGVYLLTSHHRRNPVLSIEGPDHKRHRNFVSMNKYKKMRARRAGK